MLAETTVAPLGMLIAMLLSVPGCEKETVFSRFSVAELGDVQHDSVGPGAVRPERTAGTSNIAVRTNANIQEIFFLFFHTDSPLLISRIGAFNHVISRIYGLPIVRSYLLGFLAATGPLWSLGRLLYVLLGRLAVEHRLLVLAHVEVVARAP